MTNLAPKQEFPDWDDAGWEEDRLQYVADIEMLKRAGMAQALPIDASAEPASVPMSDIDDNGPPIPFPFSDKPEYFPGFIARSALFQAGRPGGCDESELRLVRAQKHYDVMVTGPRLNMRDKRVWEIAIQIAKETSRDMCQAFEIALSDFARRMGLADRSAKTLNAIWDSLHRLSKVRVSFTLPAGHEGSGSLLATAVKIKGRTYLRVNPDFTLVAFALDAQFHIQSARRSRLSSSLAQWLHDFLSTHTDNIDLTVGYLRDLSGYPGPARNFPKALREALHELVKSVPALVEAYTIDDQCKSSIRWVVKLTRGPEKPQFSMPKAHPVGARSKGSQTPVWAAKKRRGGVVL